MHSQSLGNQEVHGIGQRVLRGPEVAIWGSASNVRTHRMILLECRICIKEKWTMEFKEQLKISLWRVWRSRL